MDTHAVLASYQYLGQPIALAFGQSNAFLVHVMNNTTAFVELAFGDQDSDSMPQWWEERHLLNDSSAADALGDPDGDGYSDFDEVLYGGNPNSQSSVPQPMTRYSESFENNPQLPGWSASEYSTFDWSLDATLGNTGTASLKSGSIMYRQTSSVRFRGFFTAGQLSFYARMDSQFCCDHISVLVDGVPLSYVSHVDQWQRHTVPISLGVHTIEWRYERDISYPQTPGVARIDDVVFVGQ